MAWHIVTGKRGAALREGARHRRLPGQPSDYRTQFPEHSAATGLASQQQCYSIMESRAVEAPAAAVSVVLCRALRMRRRDRDRGGVVSNVWISVAGVL